MLCLDKSVEFWLDEVRSGYVSLYQDRAGLFRLFRSAQVRSRYNRLRNVNSC